MTRKKLSKGKHFLHVVNKSKGLILIFSLLLSFLLIVGSTYAWQTYSDEKLNRVSDGVGSFDVILNEIFTPNLNFQPGEVHQKEVTVKNIGESSVVVRVSFYEFFLAFAHDYSDGEGRGNGNLSRNTVASLEAVTLRDTSTWKVGNTYEVVNNTYLTGDFSYLSTLGTVSTAYKYKGAANAEPFKYVTLGFNENQIFTAVQTGKQDYWLYYDGYFYYSEVLIANQETSRLLNTVSLSKKFPNRYENALYQLVPYLEAHEIQAHSFTGDWDITGKPMEQLYQGKLT